MRRFVLGLCLLSTLLPGAASTQERPALSQETRAFVSVDAATVALTHVRENLWSGPVTDEGLLKSGEFYLVASGDMQEEQLREIAPKRLKVGGAEELDLIVNRALPGVRLTYVARPPSVLPVRPDSTYFRLENQGEFWEGVGRSRAISVSVPSVFKGIKIEILATRP